MSRVRVGVEKDAAGSGQMSRGRKQQVSGEIPGKSHAVGRQGAGHKELGMPASPAEGAPCGL